MEAAKAVEILKPLVGEGKLIQTHASIVYITPEYVYKIKKPVDFGFLNYTQLKQRRAYCLLEKELNSRFSEGVYLDVLKIIERDGGFALVDYTNTLPTIEYVLKMKRIPDEFFLSNQIDSISLDDMETIGSQIAKRLSVAENSPEIVDNLGVFEQIDFNCKENFTQIEEAAPQLLDIRFEYVKKRTLAFLDKYEKLFVRRHNEGYVKDGHGDLRLEHVYIENGKVSLIDAIEFNNRFRINDVINEAAFLSMELDYNGKIELSDAFLRGFMNVYNDADSALLLNFYRCYRAVVRAKVAVFTALGSEDDSPERAAKFCEYQRMMDMAAVYALSMDGGIRPVVICGMIAAGKSHVASAFQQSFPVLRMNTDEERKKIAGMQPTDCGVAEFDKGLYTIEKSQKVYSMLGERAAAAINTGRMPLVDGTFMQKDYTVAFEAQLTQKPLYIEVTAPEEVIISRLKAREGQESVSDGRLHHYEKMKERADELPRDLIIAGTENTGLSTNKILDFLLNA